MNLGKRKLALLLTTIGTLSITGIHYGASAKTNNPVQDSATDASAVIKAKIALAMSAGPADVAQSATIVDSDAQGNTIILRAGTNDFTCMPGNSKVVGQPAMCMDGPSKQWFADAKAHKPKPSNTVPGITYMLAGATQRSDSDPNDTSSPAIDVGPHWMIMWPFDAKTTGLPTHHKATGAYIMWAGSPYAHMHIMGPP
jgi:hypothetical protein